MVPQHVRQKTLAKRAHPIRLDLLDFVEKPFDTEMSFFRCKTGIQGKLRLGFRHLGVARIYMRTSSRSARPCLETRQELP